MRVSSQSNSPTLPNIDYLLIGHLSEDRTPEGTLLGGTVCYSGLTAIALGHRVGLVTAATAELDLQPLEALSIVVRDSAHSTSFENTYTAEGRVQTLHSVADPLEPRDIPEQWKGVELVHAAPLVNEISIEMLNEFENSFIGLTPQGLMREWDSGGRISARSWKAASDAIQLVDAVVVSTADLGMDDSAAEAMAARCRVMVLTDGSGHARVWAEGQTRSIPVPLTEEVDPTGAGDIFAAVFFSRLYQSGDPWTSAEIAANIAAISVRRSGLASVPKAEDIEAAMAGASS